MAWMWVVLGAALAGDGAAAGIGCGLVQDTRGRVVEVACDLNGDGRTDETTVIAYAHAPDGTTATATTVHAGTLAGPVLRSVLATWSPSGEALHVEVDRHGDRTARSRAAAAPPARRPVFAAPRP